MVSTELTYDNVAPDTTGMPLLEFQGTLYEWNREVDEQNRHRAILNFTEVQVIKTEAKWDMPVAPIRFSINTDEEGRLKPRSSLARFLHSMHGHGIDKLDDLVGRNVHMVAEVNSFTNAEGDKQVFKVWQVDHVVATITVDPEEELLAAINGKQGAEFMPIIAGTPLLKQFQNEAIEGTLVNRLLEDNKITQNEDGSFSRV